MANVTSLSAVQNATLTAGAALTTAPVAVAVNSFLKTILLRRTEHRLKAVCYWDGKKSPAGEQGLCSGEAAIKTMWSGHYHSGA
ncbi:MAG TPA: hypothetical protein ACQGQI_09480 [Xylella sp.]